MTLTYKLPKSVPLCALLFALSLFPTRVALASEGVASSAETTPSLGVSTQGTALREQVVEEGSRSRHAVGSSLFVLANLLPLDEPPRFYQLNYHYRATPRDELSLEAITWTYRAPLGIPYGSAYGDTANNYPGSARALGLALVYKRFVWRGAYAAVHAANMHQTYFDEDGAKIQSGYQLFMTFRAGYHFEFFRDRFFIEPSIAVTSWPVNTNLPSSFQRVEDKWPNYVLAEPGLHFGVNL